MQYKEPALPAVDRQNTTSVMSETYEPARLQTLEEMNRIISYDALWDSFMKCKRGIGWKPSTKHFNLNAPEEVLKICNKLESGTWKNGKPKEIKILYPKKRDGLSISFKDRVYQRSINDNVLYPTVQRSFILDNCACQGGKGTDFARARIKKHLRRFYREHGLNGYILQIDVKGYYPNMRHDAVENKFRRYLSDEVFKAVCDVLDTQYKGEVGYNPGSQMVQIAGIALLDDLDHYRKERLHSRQDLRYMDDITIIHHDRETLEGMLEDIKGKLAEIGFEAHEKKTRITPLTHSFSFLGFKYRITKTGKIIMSLNSENVKHERRKLRRLVKLAREGRTTKAKVDECFRCWCENASKGNSFKLIQRMQRFYRELWKEEGNDRYKKHDSAR